MLDRTTWNVDRFKIYNPNNRECTIKAFNVKTITLATSGKVLAGAAVNNNRQIYSNISVEFQDPNDILKVWYSAPILRSADNFVDSKEEKVHRIYKASIAGNNEIERVQFFDFLDDNPLFSKNLFIMNDFVAANGKKYMSVFTLSRIDEVFTLLDNTNWKIKDVEVVGESGFTRDYRIANYDDDVITLRTKVEKYGEEDVRVLNFERNYQKSSEPFTADFQDLFLNKIDFLPAPILRPVSGFVYTGKQNGYKIFEAKFPDQVLPDPYKNQEQYLDREVLYISDYAPNGYIVVCNKFYLYDENNGSPIYRSYQATLTLKPYNNYKY